jgi:glycosyltransferase involved in cell wall biosynthesis
MIISFPKVSCVCTTKGRSDLIVKSIQCYLKQIYPNKELVIVSQGDDDSNNQISNYIKSLERDDISFFVVPKIASLGSMRNTSVELSKGELICQWDDDDLYHPERIMTQFQAIRSNSANTAAAYHDFLKLFSHTQELYWCDWSKEHEYSHRFLCGSIMFYKKIFHMYEVFYPEIGPQSSCEEDLNVLEKLINKGKIAPITAGNQYVYVYHGSNTYELEHHKLAIDIRWGKKVFDKESLLQNKSLLENTFQVIGIDQHVKVRSLEEVVFEYDPIKPEGFGNEV